MKVGLFIAGGVESSQKEIVKAIVYTLSKLYEIIIFTTNSGNKLKYLLQDNCSLVHLDEMTSKDNWIDKYNESVKIIKKYNISNMFIIKQTILQSYNYNNGTIIENYIQNWKINPKFSMNFNMMKTLYEKICFITAIAKTCKTIEFVIDPQQIQVNKYINFEYGYKNFYILNKKEIGLEYANFYEPYYYNTEKQDKQKDFCFACTALTKDRKYIINCEDKFKKTWLIKIVKSNKTGKKLSQQEYYEWLKQSKYTLIIPSYDVSTFSIIRFVEALKYGCIPLIHIKCNLNDLKYTFEELYDYVNDKLIINKIACIQDKINELDYNKVLEDLQKILKNAGIYNIKKIKNKIEKEWRN